MPLVRQLLNESSQQVGEIRRGLSTRADPQFVFGNLGLLEARSRVRSGKDWVLPLSVYLEELRG